MSKVKTRYCMTVNNWKCDSKFSYKLAILRIMCDFSSRLHLRKIATWSIQKKDQWILKYLKNLLSPIIEKYEDDTYIGEKQDNAPIWICWWTGEENAPQLVKQCIKSIRRNAGTHPVHMITEQNYIHYLEIPDFIIDKVNNQDMCIANFTDYLRVSLLEKYGGLWLDATIFCRGPIPEHYFNDSVFTCKSPYAPNGYLSNGRWTSFCLGGWKKNVFYQFFKEALECYWKQNSCSVDYLLVDYMIEIAYRYLEVVREGFEKIQINNVHRDDLQAAMNQALPAEEFWNVIQNDTILYKLSWREKYSVTTEDNKDSIYQFFLNLRLDM